MERSKYDYLLGSVFSEIDVGSIELCLREWRRRVRLDMFLGVLRDAFLRSSIGTLSGVPYYFSGMIYERLPDCDLGNLVYDLMKRCNLPDGDYQSSIDSIMRVLRRVISSKTLEVQSDIVVFRNCVYDTASGDVHKFSPEFVQTSYVDYDYVSGAMPMMWSMFLDQVLPDVAYQNVLQEFMGAMFIDRRTAKMETMMILKGSGGNGKSVVFETIMGVLGRDSVSNFGIQALVGGSERKKNLAYINGKRLNYCSEIQTLEFGKDSDALKALISGEPQEARFMYGDNFTAYNIPLLMANANQLPFLKDTSYGMRRRMCIVPFDVEIPKSEQRKDLSYEMRKEYPAIFNWIMEGRARFVKNGYKLTDNKELEEVLDEYQGESSSVLKFMYSSEYMSRYEDVVVEPLWLSSKTLYRDYVKWSMSNGINPDSLTGFGRTLVGAGYRKKRSGTGFAYAVYGAKLLRDIQKRAYQLTMKDKPKDGNGIEIFAGKRYAYGTVALSRVVFLGPTALQRAISAGHLEGLFHMSGNTMVFDIDAVIEKLREIGAYGKSEKEKMDAIEKERALNASRLVFNDEMNLRGMPFRKGYIRKSQADVYIPVADDWEYSDEEAERLISIREKELAEVRDVRLNADKEQIERIMRGEEDYIPVDDTKYMKSRRKLKASRDSAPLGDAVGYDMYQPKKRGRGRPRKVASVTISKIDD